MDGSANVTAAVVASTLLLLKDDPELASLADSSSRPAIEAALRQSLPLFGPLLDWVPWRVLRRAALVAEAVVSPGFIAHYALRKQAVRARLVAAVDGGATQVVLVGAGLDMLARSVPPGVRVFEVDLPGTQLARRRAASEADQDVLFVPLDLTTQRLAHALGSLPVFDASADTVFVAEGLLMYLTKVQVEALLADMCGGPGRRRLILTVVTPDQHDRVRLHTQRRVVDWCMRWLDEPFVWGESRANLESLLVAHGLTVDEILSTMDVRDQMLSAKGRGLLPYAPGELIVSATKMNDAASHGTDLSGDGRAAVLL